ncbi:MAG: hypothetical protein Tsb0015_09600 [Simkaniaceae bacterium]
MFRSEEHHSYKDFFLGAFIGGTLGAMSALFFGTKKGKKLQREIAHKYQEINHSAEEFLKHFTKEPPQKRKRKR